MLLYGFKLGFWFLKTGSVLQRSYKYSKELGRTSLKSRTVESSNMTHANTRRLRPKWLIMALNCGWKGLGRRHCHMNQNITMSFSLEGNYADFICKILLQMMHEVRSASDSWAWCYSLTFKTFYKRFTELTAGLLLNLTSL